MSDPSAPMGVVLGSRDSTPLDFWIGVRTADLHLDDLVVASSHTQDGQEVRFYGIVEEVVKRHEGAQFDSDAFRVRDGTLPAELSYIGHVRVTRVEPEYFFPPTPGDPVSIIRGEEVQQALYFDDMERRVPIGLTRTGLPVYADLDFLDGTRGAHASISGVSGVATKTSYATFLLYALFHSNALGRDATNAKALIFNVKGEDLLWLDRPNVLLDERSRAAYQTLELPVGAFRSVGLFAPPRKGSNSLVPAVGGRQEGIAPYVWTMRDVAEQRLLRFTFAGAEDTRAQLSMVVERVERELSKAAQQGRQDPWVVLENAAGRTWKVGDLSDLLTTLEEGLLEEWTQSMRTAPGTVDAFLRRLHGAAARMGHLIRSDSEAAKKKLSWSEQQVTVIDLHTLHSDAQMFVVGSVLKRLMEEKEGKGTAKPQVFVVLDELNKYAPREGWSPIHETLLDIAERGRSLGVCLLGAQQTASEVERRVVANAAIKVVGRLDPAEAQRAEYRFMTPTTRNRATILKPGTMIVAQPQIPTPIVLTFPFPSWATRQSEALPPTAQADLFGHAED
ncbi:MAG: ATP-binding protein [Alphaproteobacteria bacterium]|nr:ATP-binding protein [Alphaproteobacteria bacterium]